MNQGQLSPGSTQTILPLGSVGLGRAFHLLTPLAQPLQQPVLEHRRGVWATQAALLAMQPAKLTAEVVAAASEVVEKFK